MHFIQEISTKEIETITDSSHIEQSTRNIDCHGRCTYFLLGSCSNKNFGHIFEDVCFVFFSSTNFYTVMAQEWCNVSGQIIQMVYLFAPIILNKLHAMLFAANVHEFILLPRISSLGQRKQFYDSKYSQFGMRPSIEFV